MTTKTLSVRKLSRISLAAGLVFTAGCGKAAEKVAEKATEKAMENEIGGDVDLNTDGKGGVRLETDQGTYEADGNGNYNIETEDGTVSASADIPEGWPEDVPLPEDLKVMSGTSSDMPDSKVLSVAGSSELAPQKVLEDMKAALSDWEVKTESTMEASSGTVAGAEWSLGDRRVSLSATSGTDGETQVMVTHVVQAS